MSQYNSLELQLTRRESRTRLKTNRRVCAWTRGRFPALFYIPGIVLGELLSPYISSMQLLLLLGMILILQLNLRLGFIAWALYLSTTLGALAMKLAYPMPLLANALEENRSYLAKVDLPPRRPAVGVVKLSLQIFSVHNVNGGWVDLPVPLRFLCRATDLPWRAASKVKEGDQIVIKGKFRGLRWDANPFAFDNGIIRDGYVGSCNLNYASATGIKDEGTFTRWREHIKSRVREILGNNEDSGLFLSMSIGTRDQLSRNTEEAFKRTGLAHLLVVSGYQVTIVFALMLAIFWRVLFLCKIAPHFISIPKLSRLLGLIAAVLFMLLVGVEGSSLRAAFAVLFVVLAQIFERRGGMLNGIIAAFISLSIVWPGSFLDPGVQLTFAALLGLAFGVNEGFQGQFGQYLKGCLFASFFTSIVVLIWFGNFSLIGFLLNPIIAPAASVISVQGGFAALIACLVGLDPEGYLIKGVATLLLFLRDSILWLSGFNWIAWHFDGLERWLAVFMLCLAAFVIVRNELKGVKFMR